MSYTCEMCSSIFEKRRGRIPRFCSRRCKVRWHNNQSVSLECPECHQTRTLTRCAFNKRKSDLCVVCANSHRSGANSATWRGGHRHWSPGRFGRDKDGLSWKAQRRLAWERDNYTCQECGKHKDGWKPDVHHISPFRVSQSHALENLKCLCRRCHLKVEAQVQESWGGAAPARRPRAIPPRHACSRCSRVFVYTHRIRMVDGLEVCPTCERAYKISKAQELKAQGFKEHEIATKLGLSSGSAHYYSIGVGSSKTKVA